MIFVYDGSYEGFLSAVFDAYSLKIKPLNISAASGDIQIDLGGKFHYVEAADEKADRLIAGMEKIGFADKVLFAFLSWMLNKEMTIYRYIIMGFNLKEKILTLTGNDIVNKVNDMCSQTANEKYRMRGFLRFSVMKNSVHFAEISPKNNVLPLIMPHFSRRMGTMPFLIHDMTYKQVGLYDNLEWFICSSENLILPGLHSDEEKYRKAWKLFYDTTAVEGRENLEYRNKKMPARYHKHITELQNFTNHDSPEDKTAFLPLSLHQ